MAVRGGAWTLVLALGLEASIAAAQEIRVVLAPVASGLTRPVTVTHSGDGSGRLFVAEQGGRIRIVRDGVVEPAPFLDLSARVSCCGERGLLGLAFHPQFASNGFFFVDYTDRQGDTVVARYSVSAANPDRADASSAAPVLRVEQPFANHNGGQLTFGPDGYLYVALGDGGNAGDPGDRAQDLQTLLGKLLRIDVDDPDPGRRYSSPESNPFVGRPGSDEIWAFGLRNPWRFSFDRSTGDLLIADVGQNNWEEVDFQPAGDAGGRNYGWDVLEARHCFESDPAGDGSCSAFLSGGSTLPVLEYSHALGCSVTGGYVYRGTREPALGALYLFADFCSGRVWGAVPRCGGAWSMQALAGTGFRVSTLGEDEAGEVFLVSYGEGAGRDRLFRLRAVPVAVDERLRVRPRAIDFGRAGQGSMRLAGLQVTNVASGAVRLERIAVTGSADFSVDTSGGATPCGSLPFLLPAGESCTLNVAFTPSRGGGHRAGLELDVDGTVSSVPLAGHVACSGDGPADPVPNPPPPRLPRQPFDRVP